jgi:hypothetical protein
MVFFFFWFRKNEVTREGVQEPVRLARLRTIEWGVYYSESQITSPFMVGLQKGIFTLFSATVRALSNLRESNSKMHSGVCFSSWRNSFHSRMVVWLGNS